MIAKETNPEIISRYLLHTALELKDYLPSLLVSWFHLKFLATSEKVKDIINTTHLLKQT